MLAESLLVSLALGLACAAVASSIHSRWWRVGLGSSWLLVSLILPMVGAELRARQVDVDPIMDPREEPRLGYVGSKTCQACHPHEYDTWRHSWHRTMTQIASPESVLGDFDDVHLEQGNVSWLLSQDGETLTARRSRAAGRMTQDVDWSRHGARRIVLTTGSHHMQVYWLSRGAGADFGLLPFAWLKQDARWVPREATFLQTPKHRSNLTVGRWRDSCIHCHTTRGVPERPAPASSPVRGATELGIACEACHAGASEHVSFHRLDPVSRYLQRLSHDPDPSIVNPTELVKERAVEVCGQCHSAHLPTTPKEGRHALTSGYRYEPGVDLEESGKRVLRGGPASAAFSEDVKRYSFQLDQVFWPDGMIRVAGREMNGLLESACYQHGELTCSSCHQLHQSPEDARRRADWADDQLAAEMRGDAACTQCHLSYAEDAEAHTHHRAGSSGSRCQNCHMPHTTWGLLKAIRQHEIDSPSVHASQETGRPNACNACHLDQPLAWSAEHLAAWYGQPMPEMTHDETTIAAALLWLLEGNAGQRALIAWHMGWEPARRVSGEAWLAPYLGELLDDRYAAVRYVAGRSLRSLPGFTDLDFDYVAQPEERARARREARERWDDSRPRALGPKPSVLLLEDGSLDKGEVARLLRQRSDPDMALLE